MSFLRSLRAVASFRSYERDADLRRLQSVANVSDLRTVAKRRLPAGVFDYIDGGAEDEVTYRRNESAFHQWEFKPSVLRDVSHIDTSSSLLGRALSMPVILAPTGFTRIVMPEGELAVARAAARSNLPYALSSVGTRSIEDVSRVSEGPKWFQVYVWKDKGLVRDLIQRADAAGFEALCVTVDLAVVGRRERDVRRGFTLPPRAGIRTVFEALSTPSWAWNLIRSEPITFASADSEKTGKTAVDLADFVATQFDSSLSWKDIEWIRSEWKGPLVIKGIQSVRDALNVVASGADALVVSNHGGRQLDGAPATLRLVRPIREAVGANIEVVCDGGVRRGSDIVKSLALGASAVMIGRPYLYGLAAAGERGVDWVLEFFRDGLVRTMALCGVTSIGDIDEHLVTRSD